MVATKEFVSHLDMILIMRRTVVKKSHGHSHARARGAGYPRAQVAEDSVHQGPTSPRQPSPIPTSNQTSRGERCSVASRRSRIPRRPSSPSPLASILMCQPGARPRSDPPSSHFHLTPVPRLVSLPKCPYISTPQPQEQRSCERPGLQQYKYNTMASRRSFLSSLPRRLLLAAVLGAVLLHGEAGAMASRCWASPSRRPRQALDRGLPRRPGKAAGPTVPRPARR
jgi:hypothetical protein